MSDLGITQLSQTYLNNLPYLILQLGTYIVGTFVSMDCSSPFFWGEGGGFTPFPRWNHPVPTRKYYVKLTSIGTVQVM